MKRLVLVVIAIWLSCSGSTFTDETFSFNTNYQRNVYCDECGSYNIDITIEEFAYYNESRPMSEYPMGNVRIVQPVYHPITTTLTCLDCGYQVEKVQ
jgi:hypothetical protein